MRLPDLKLLGFSAWAEKRAGGLPAVRLNQAIIHCFLLFVWISAASHAAEQETFYPQGQSGSRAAALGGEGVALPGSADSVFQNPAGLVGIHGPEVAAGFGGGNGSQQAYLAAAYPLLGQLTLGIAGLTDSSLELRSGVLSLAFPLSRDGKMILGLTGKMVQSNVNTGSESASGAGLDLGLLYPVWDTDPNLALRLGIALLDAQTVVRTSNEEIHLPNRFRLGAAFNLNPDRLITVGFDSQQSQSAGYDSFQVLRLGLEQCWKLADTVRFHLRLGGLKRLDQNVLATAGMGADWDDWRLEYALQLPSGTGTTHHQLGVSWGWQRKNTPREIPAPVPTPAEPGKPAADSDSGDASHNSLLSALEVAAKRDEHILLEREENKPTRTPTPEPEVRNAEPVEEETYHIPMPVGPADQEKNTGVVPEMPALFSASAQFGPKQNMRLVNQDLRLHVVVNPFSPNRDGRQDKTMFVASLNSDKYHFTRWFLDIVSGSRVLNTFRGGAMLPRNLEWDGRDKKGTTLPDGSYQAVLRLLDENGIEILHDIQTVKIQTKSESIAMKAPEAVLLTGGPDDKPLEFSVPPQRNSGDWQFTMVSPSGRRVYEKSGDTQVPQTLRWNAHVAGKPAPAGRYRAVLNFRDEIGLKVKAEADFVVKYASLNAGLNAEPELFQPAARNGQGVTFQPRAEGDAKIKSWTLKIIQKDQSNPIRTLAGEGMPPERVVWDGATDAGEPVKGGGIFSGLLTVLSVLGNEAEAESQKLQCDLGAYAGEKALAINLVRVQFRPGSADLTDEARKALSTAAGTLGQYKTNFQLQITGHSDDTEVGKEKENELSRNRATTVMDYMIQQRIPAERIQSVGKGSSQPLAREQTEEGRSKNRRVEILLFAQ